MQAADELPCKKRFLGYVVGDTGPAQSAATNKHWGWLIQNYLGTFRTTITQASDLRILVCPESPQRFGFGNNHSANGIWNNGFPTLQYFVQTVRIARPDEKVYYADSTYTATGMAAYAVSDTKSWNDWHPFIDRGSMVGARISVNFVHRNRGNVCWVDGHVSSVAVSESLVAPGDPACFPRWWDWQ